MGRRRARRTFHGLVPGPVAWWIAACLAPAAALAADSSWRADGLPLDPTRTIRFETSEGTWMSVDVSPSGDDIVFDLLGDIWSVPSGGGRARRLVGGMDWAVQPTWSPDGSTIAFVSDRSGSMNLWLYDVASGEVTRFTRERAGEQIFFADPEWSPDGSSLLVWTTRRRNWFLGNLPREIRRYPIAGAGQRFESLTGSGEGSISGAESPALSPDGRFLYYARFEEQVSPFYGDRVLPEWQLEVQDLETGLRSPLTAHQGGAMAPALSPDGRYLAYGSRDGADTGLRLLDLKTGSDKWLVFPVDRDQQESNAFYNLPAMSFMPDSRELVAAFGGRINRVELATGRIRSVPFEAQVELELGPLVQPSFSVAEDSIPLRRIRTPRLSPDRSQIAFEALGRIWLVPANGGTPARLNDDPRVQYDPVWSPSGESIVYCGWSDEAGGQVYRQPLGGEARPARLTEHAGNYAAPAFAADGRTIYVTRIGGGHPEAWSPPFDIVELSPGGGEQRLATIPFPGRVWPAGNPKTLYVGHAGTLYELTLSETAGLSGPVSDIVLAERPHTAGAAGMNVSETDLIVPSPDGTRYLVQAAGHVYLLEGREGERERAERIVLEDVAGGVTRLTDAGGEFPGWSADGRSILYALGDRIFRHDRDASGKFSVQPSSVLELSIDGTVHNPESIVALTNVRIVTMSREGVIDDGTVVIRNQRIEQAGPSGQVTIPPAARLIDGRGATVLPGFIDSHAHPSTGEDFGARSQQPTAFLGYLAYGVTTIHDPAQALRDLEYGDLISAGELLGPRIYGTGPEIEWWKARLGSYEDARALLARYAEGWRTNTVKQYVAGDRRERQWIVAAAAAANVLPTIEGEDLNYNLTHVIDGYGNIGHSIGVAPLYTDVVRLLAGAGTSIQYQFGTLRGEGAPSAMYYFLRSYDVWADDKASRYIPPARLQQRLARRLEIHPREHAFPLMARQAGALMNAGVTVSLGDHGEWGGLGMHWEIRAASSGMSNHDALRMATIMGARAIGLQDDLGSIEPGKLADLLVIDGDPLEDIRDTLRLRYVMKNGELFDPDTLDRVWPRPTPLEYTPWWRNRVPRMRSDAVRQGGAPDSHAGFENR